LVGYGKQVQKESLLILKKKKNISLNQREVALKGTLYIIMRENNFAGR